MGEITPSECSSDTVNGSRGAHVHGQSTLNYFSNFPTKEKGYESRGLMAKLRQDLHSYWVKK